MHAEETVRIDFAALKDSILAWARELGFQKLGVADVELSTAEQRLRDWLAQGYQGGMDYLARHGTRRSRPAELVPGTRSGAVRADGLLSARCARCRSSAR